MYSWLVLYMTRAHQGSWYVWQADNFCGKPLQSGTRCVDCLQTLQQLVAPQDMNSSLLVVYLLHFGSGVWNYVSATSAGKT